MATTTKPVAPTKEQDEISRLYEISSKLDSAGENIEKHEDLYMEIVKAKGSVNAKKFAAQFIPRYFKFFPKQEASARESLIDLCEEDDMQIRILAVRAFPQLGGSKVKVLADVLGQLLQSETQVELDNVKHSLIALLRINALEVLQALFYQISNRDKTQREKAMAFLKEKVYPLREELINKDKEVEAFVAERIKAILPTASTEEFKTLMAFWTSLKSFQGENSKELLEILADHANLKSDFKATDTGTIDKLIACLHLAVPFFQSGGSSVKFTEYLGNKVIPEFNNVPDSQKLGLLQSIAEISPYANAQEARILLPAIYSLIKAHLPESEKSDIKMNFSHIESLLFTFHQLGSKTPGSLRGLCGITILTGQPSDFDALPEDPAIKLQEFSTRLKHLEETTNKTLKDISSNTDKAGAAQTALTITKNIRALVRTLLQPKPQFVSPQTMRLSWQTEKRKPTTETTTSNNNNTTASKNEPPPKRHAKETNTTTTVRTDNVRRNQNQNNRGNNRGRGRGGRGRW